MQRSTHYRALAAALAFFMLSAPVQASKVIFLNSISGSDSGTCGSPTGAACKTLQQAVDNADPGDTLYLVVAGDYKFAFITKPLTIQGVTGAGVFTNSNPCLKVDFPPPGAVVIKEFTCDQALAAPGILAVDGAALILEQVVVRAHNGRRGMGVDFVGSSGQNLSIHNSIISGFSSGVRIRGGLAVLENVTLDSNQVGVEAASTSTSTVQVSVSNCIVKNNPDTGISAAGLRTTVNVTDTSVAFNGVGLDHANNSALISLGGNSVIGNTVNGTFTATSGPQ